jgi:ABC-2 type transport system permease protein
MLVLIAYVFTFAIYTQATVSPETLNLATISVVDEDRSQLSSRIAGAFYPPWSRRKAL